MKTCKTCKHMKNQGDTFLYAKCGIGIRQEAHIDPISGEELGIEYYPCSVERMNYPNIKNHCGPDGKKWMAKDE